MSYLGIGICGHAGAGKDTVADALLQLLREDYFITKYAFAEPIYRMLATLFGDNVSDWTDQSKRNEVMFGTHTRRSLMQTLGTEWGRGFLGFHKNQALWTHIANKHRLDLTVSVVYNGCRFSDEIEFIRNNYKIPCFILVTRPSINPSDTHASEHLASDESWRGTFDIIIDNDSTIEVLQDKATSAFSSWFSSA